MKPQLTEFIRRIEVFRQRQVAFIRPVALIGRAAVSKTACWGFESLLACVRKGQKAIMNKIVKFVNEVKMELKKVSWSTRQELINSTIVVIVSVAILAVFIGICDLVWSNVINFILR